MSVLSLDVSHFGLIVSIPLFKATETVYRGPISGSHNIPDYWRNSRRFLNILGRSSVQVELVKKKMRKWTEIIELRRLRINLPPAMTDRIEINSNKRNSFQILYLLPTKIAEFAFYYFGFWRDSIGLVLSRFLGFIIF